MLPTGETVEAWTLAGRGGLMLEAITYGGIVTRLLAQDRNGSAGDVVLGFNDLDSYLGGHPYFGAITGRVAGRISGAAFTLDGGMLRNVALVGLGMGALTCFAQPNEHWTLYELDPLIVEIAKDRRLFRSMAACARHATVVVGDGRLTLADARPGIDLLILDAFSSDAVPTHLLTKEAFALYAARLGPHGVIVVHISNKNMELSGVVAASAAANGMVTAIKTDRGSADQARTLRLPAEVAVVARSSADLEALRLDSTWRPAVPARRVWTDDYSNVLAAIIRKLRE